MSVERIWHWTCSGCKLTAERHDPGFPQGWIYLPRTILEPHTRHYCEECRETIPEGQRWHPQVVAEK